MKKLLLPFILLFTIPFNSSCIKEITFNVTVKYGEVGNENCSWDEPTIAYMGKDYSLRFYVKEGWQLAQDENCFQIEAGFKELLQPICWTYVDGLLVINGQFVTKDIIIQVIPFLIE